MTDTLCAGKRKRACRTSRSTGRRNCAALKVGQPACPDGACRGKDQALVGHGILRQREALTCHLPKAKIFCRCDPESGVLVCRHNSSLCFARNQCTSPTRGPRSCRRIEPQTKRARHDGTDRFECRAAVPCPPGHCFARFGSAVSEVGVHEYARIHGAKDGAGNYWELAALALAGERPHPARLLDRDEMCRELRARQRKS